MNNTESSMQWNSRDHIFELYYLKVYSYCLYYSVQFC
jgi:hypothetical protein